MKPWTIENNVGRLVEARPRSIPSREDAIAYCAEFRLLVPPLQRVVICADYRAISIFPPEVADELTRLMTELNKYIERSAILIASDHATSALQMQRVVREAHNENRRRFTDARDLAAWLGGILAPHERDRLEQFLA